MRLSTLGVIPCLPRAACVFLGGFFVWLITEPFSVWKAEGSPLREVNELAGSKRGIPTE